MLFHPKDEDLNGNSLGEGVVVVKINNILSAGADRDISDLVPSTERESKSNTKPNCKIRLDTVKTIRWSKSLVRARADIIAKAKAANAGDDDSLTLQADD